MFRYQLLEEKRGHQAPVGWRINEFNSIEFEPDFAYCDKYNFAFDKHKEMMKLYLGLPCFHTDVRYNTYDPFRGSVLYYKRYDYLSLKACIRRTMRCKGLPKGTIVKFNKGFHHRNSKVDNSYKFVVKKENPIDIKYELNDPELYNNFSTCKFSRELTNALRQNGFLVFVEPNKSFLISMLNVGAEANGSELIPNIIEGEVATAFGHGKKIGFSSYNNDLYGYTLGEDNILWDRFGEFDKWSRCETIPKTTSVQEIINILIKPNEDE